MIRACCIAKWAEIMRAVCSYRTTTARVYGTLPRRYKQHCTCECVCDVGEFSARVRLLLHGDIGEGGAFCVAARALKILLRARVYRARVLEMRVMEGLGRVLLCGSTEC